MANNKCQLENECSENRTVTLFSIQYNIDDLESFNLNVNFEELYKYFAALLNDEKISQSFDATIISKLLAEQISKFNCVANSIFKDIILLNNINNFHHPKSVPKSVPTAASNPMKSKCAKKRKVENMSNPNKKRKENFKCEDVQHMLNANKIEEEFTDQNFQYVSNPSSTQKKLKAQKVQKKFHDLDEQHILNPNTLEELRDTKKCGGPATDNQNEEHNKLQSKECEQTFTTLQGKIFHYFDEFETNLLGIKQKLKDSNKWVKAYNREVEERKSNFEEWYNNCVTKLPQKNKNNDGGIMGSKPKK